MLARFREHDVAALVYPTLVSPALKIGAPVPAEAFARSTTLAPCCGHPGLVLPAGLTTAGLPVGLEFDGLPGTDRELLALGAAVEQVWGPLPAPAL